MQSPHTYTSIPVLTVKHTHNWPILEHHTEYLEGGKNHIQKYSISTTNWTFKRSIEDINTFPHINIFFPFYTFITPSTVNIYITSNYHSKWHTAGQNLCTSNVFFSHCLFRIQEACMQKIIQVYFVNIVNPNIFIIYPHVMYIYTKICEKDYRRI